MLSLSRLDHVLRQTCIHFQLGDVVAVLMTGVHEAPVGGRCWHCGQGEIEKERMAAQSRVSEKGKVTGASKVYPAGILSL